MIKFEHVDKVYGNGVKAMDDVSLEISQGEFVAIIGLSGAGKSTLIRTINKMIDISAGKLTVNGTDVSTLKGKSLRKFRRKIGMVFQSFNLISRISVIHNVLSARVAELSLFRVLFGLYSRQDKTLALESLDKVGILEKAYIRADQLSGGQQQRVAIARAIVTQPAVLLADEPTGNLDSARSVEVMEMITRFNQESGITVVMVTHEPDMAAFASRVVHFHDGLVASDERQAGAAS